MQFPCQMGKVWIWELPGINEVSFLQCGNSTRTVQNPSTSDICTSMKRLSKAVIFSAECKRKMSSLVWTHLSIGTPLWPFRWIRQRKVAQTSRKLISSVQDQETALFNHMLHDLFQSYIYNQCYRFISVILLLKQDKCHFWLTKHKHQPVLMHLTTCPWTTCVW